MVRYCINIIVVSLILLGLSCKNDMPEDNVQLEIGVEGDIEVGSIGGQIEIPYSIENPSGSYSVTVSAGSEWLHDFDTTDDGVIRFVADPNMGSVKRFDTLTIRYGYMSVRVNVVQLSEADEKPQVVLTSDIISYVGRNRGSVDITYDILNPDDSAELRISCDEDWICNIDSGREGVITLTLTTNYTQQKRDAFVKVRYASSNFTAMITQSGEGEILFEATEIGGAYYGDQLVDGIGNYWVIFSDNGFDEYGRSYPHSVYYRIDAYADKYVAESASMIPLPVGHYILDVDNTHAVGTFTVKNSGFWYTDGIGKYSEITPIESGEMVVEKSGVTLNLYINGEPHHIEYNDRVWLDNQSSTPLYSSTLQADYVAQLDNHYVETLYKGVVSNTKLHNWLVRVLPNSDVGDVIDLNIVSEHSDVEALLNGSYIASDELSEEIFYTGFSLGSIRMGSWYYTSDYEQMAPLRQGVVTFEPDSGGMTTMTLDAEDDKGYAVVAWWQGMVDIEN